MKKRMLMLWLAACLLFAAPAWAEGAARPRILMMACYQQVGWGVRAKATFLDEAGDIWFYENESGLPKTSAERLELLQQTEDATRVGQLSADRVAELQSLIAAIQPEEVQRRSGNISDYGQDTYSAIRYDDDGAADILCLALWGDWMYEHSDANARAAYGVLMTEVLGKKLDSDRYSR